MSTYLRGHQLLVGIGYATIYADIDFETYSEAGYYFSIDRKWKSTGTAQKAGLAAVGAMNYSLHPSTEVLCMAYDLKDGTGRKLWSPFLHSSLPMDLIEFVQNGGILEAHNSGFEHHIWNNVLHVRFGWPKLDHTQQRCSMAKARAYSLPGALGKAAKALHLSEQKDTEGTRLIRKFCKPRNPTKKDLRTRILPQDDPEDFKKLCDYCLQDIATESELSQHIPDLQPDELEFWLNTQKSNYKGVGIRMSEVNACISILETAYPRYNQELLQVTLGVVPEASKVTQIIEWCRTQGVHLTDLDDDTINLVLEREVPYQVRRALEIRQLISSAAVKKVYAIRRTATPKERVCDLFTFHGARTGRDTSVDVQLQNLTKAGPKIQWCTCCEKPFGMHHTDTCPMCGASVPLFAEKRNNGAWSWEAVDPALEVIASESLDLVEHIFGDALLTISGCVRGLFVSANGNDFIASDYSAIEAVVAATLSGEQWRIDLFHGHGKIYEESASRITGVPFEEMMDYKRRTGDHHPDRNKFGKFAELACGFGGWVGAWKGFGADKYLTDEEMITAIKAWRKASPAIVEMWGGQPNWRRNEFYGLEGMAILAVSNPGQIYSYRDISYGVKDDVLYCRLPSGRTLTYHEPRVTPSSRRQGTLELSFMGWNSNAKMGPKGWVRLSTFGGRLFENVVQAVSRDIMRDATNRLERHGYSILLRVHDELVAEVPEGWGSIEEFEQLMGELPEWAKGWPVRAAGGWRGKRYRKD